MKFSKLQANGQKYIESEISASTYIPYKYHWDSSTIMLKNNSFMKIIKINGFSFETADDDEIDLRKENRNNLFKGMASGSFLFWIHTVRKKRGSFPKGRMSNTFTKYVNDEWKKRQDKGKSYINEHYISIIRQESKKGIALLSHLARHLKGTTNKSVHDKHMEESFSELEEVTDRFINGFANYGAELLSIEEDEESVFSEIMEFLGSIVNVGFSQKYTITRYGIDRCLPICRLYFGSKTIEVKTPLGYKYAGIVSLKEYRSSSNAGIFDGFLQMQFDFFMTQTYEFIDRMIAISSMQLQQRRLIQSEDVAVSQIQEIDEALDAAMSGTFAFGKHSMSIMCIEDSVKALENSLSMAIVEFANVGITAVREKMNMEPIFWGQLPGNDLYLSRRSTVNTLNLASFASFHNYPSGRLSHNHWGPAATVLSTVSGTPYFFSFHVRDVGHTMIVGPTGAGKTVLMNFLCAQAQKFDCKTFFFDKDRGAEIFIRAIGGKYTTLTSGEKSGFNPFQLNNTPENRSFLISFLKALVTANGEIVDATDVSKLTDAINGNYKLPKKKRILRNIAPFLGLTGPGTLAGSLSQWYGNGSHAKLFDNDIDIVNFTTDKCFGFEMASLLKDPVSIAPTLLYLFHKIDASLDGSPTMIVLDEAWALIDNPVFAPTIKDWLKVLRKKNAFVMLATQSVEDASKSDISETLVQQTSTQIFLPNLKATEAYRTVFMLSEREFSLVKSTDPSTRFFLVKQDNSGVIARLELNGMDKIIRVLSGRSETVALMYEIINEVGSYDPDNWLDIYYERSKHI